MPESIQRDLDREASKMLKDIEAIGRGVADFQRHYARWQGYHEQYKSETVRDWAKLALTHPKTLLLIIETTEVTDEQGYTYNTHEPIRVTTYNPHDDVLQDWLVEPIHTCKITGTSYHGLTGEHLLGKPHFAEVWGDLVDQLRESHVIIFGYDWARSAIRTIIGNPHVLDQQATCLHNKCKEYYGEFYHLSLEAVLSYQGIEKTRSELADSRERIQVLAQVIGNLAEGKAKVQEVPDTPVSSESVDFLDELDMHPF